MASPMRSIACVSAVLPGRWPLTMMEKARVEPEMVAGERAAVVSWRERVFAGL